MTKFKVGDMVKILPKALNSDLITCFREAYIQTNIAIVMNIINCQPEPILNIRALVPKGRFQPFGYFNASDCDKLEFDFKSLPLKERRNMFFDFKIIKIKGVIRMRDFEALYHGDKVIVNRDAMNRYASSQFIKGYMNKGYAILVDVNPIFNDIELEVYREDGSVIRNNFHPRDVYPFPDENIRNMSLEERIYEFTNIMKE